MSTVIYIYPNGFQVLADSGTPTVPIANPTGDGGNMIQDNWVQVAGNWGEYTENVDHGRAYAQHRFDSTDNSCQLVDYMLARETSANSLVPLYLDDAETEDEIVIPDGYAAHIRLSLFGMKAATGAVGCFWSSVRGVIRRDGSTVSVPGGSLYTGTAFGTVALDTNLTVEGYDTVVADMQVVSTSTGFKISVDPNTTDTIRWMGHLQVMFLKRT